MKAKHMGQEIDVSENRTKRPPTPVLFVGDNCILENHLTSSSLFFDFGNHTPTLAQQERLARCWNHHDELIKSLRILVDEVKNNVPGYHQSPCVIFAEATLARATQ